MIITTILILLLILIILTIMTIVTIMIVIVIIIIIIIIIIVIIRIIIVIIIIIIMKDKRNIIVIVRIPKETTEKIMTLLSWFPRNSRINGKYVRKHPRWKFICNNSSTFS